MDFNLQTFYEQLQETCKMVSSQRPSPFYTLVIFKSDNGVIFHVYLDVMRRCRVDHINISQ